MVAAAGAAVRPDSVLVAIQRDVGVHITKSVAEVKHVVLAKALNSVACPRKSPTSRSGIAATHGWLLEKQVLTSFHSALYVNLRYIDDSRPSAAKQGIPYHTFAILRVRNLGSYGLVVAFENVLGR